MGKEVLCYLSQISFEETSWCPYGAVSDVLSQKETFTDVIICSHSDMLRGT